MPAPKGNKNAGKNKPGIKPLRVHITFSQEETLHLSNLYQVKYGKEPSMADLAGYVREVTKTALKQ